jgi:hypothetical protein
MSDRPTSSIAERSSEMDHRRRKKRDSRPREKRSSPRLRSSDREALPPLPLLPAKKPSSKCPSNWDELFDESEEEKDNHPLLKPSREDREKERNTRRILEANDSDRDLLGKYLPDSASKIFTHIVSGADDMFEPPPWLMEAVAEVAKMPVESPSNPDVHFDITEEALDHNTRLLSTFDFDFEKMLASQTGTTLDYGSEFRPVEQLEKVIGRHPNFEFFKTVIRDGMTYHFKTEITEEERKTELAEQLARGNHKSANESGGVAEKLLLKDVLHGFSLPIHADAVPNIKGAMVEPCGIARQFKLQADGSRKLADRLTHDLTYSISKPDASVNSRVDMGMYTEMIYGWCLSRVIHYIVALRIKYPDYKIFISKYDYSDAYRRVAHSASAAVQSILVLGAVAYIALRLAFGGAPNPPTWCSFSEMVTDLSNEISLCKEWDPSALHSPDQPVTPVPRSLPMDIPFAQGKPLAVDVPVAATTRTDSFIDDLIRVFLDTEENRTIGPHAVPLAIFVTNRPHSGEEEPIRRRAILSESKLEAEGLPVELQIVLGWLLDTRRLLILLPEDKLLAWEGDMTTIIETEKATFGDLESLVGRLNHVSYLLPLGRHFLDRLRWKIRKRRHKNQMLTMSKQELLDLVLFLEYLQMARAGISMNRLTVRQPSRIGWADSCPYGLGGLSLVGWGWRILIPEASPLFGLDTANNVLEFLAMGINIWIIILECARDGMTEECILVLGDSTSALGWLYRTGKIEKTSFYYEAVQMIARKIARLIIGSSHSLASQHLKGELNVVADLLSYSGTSREKPHPLAADNPDNAELTRRFHSSLPQLIPESFEICQLPAEILSFATLVLQTTESSYIRSRKLRTKAGTEFGGVGDTSVGTPTSAITPTSIVFPDGKKSSSCEPSFQFTEDLDGTDQEKLLAVVESQWLQTLSEMPQAIWLRRFGTISNQAPFTSKAARGSSPLSAPY